MLIVRLACWSGLSGDGGVIQLPGQPGGFDLRVAEDDQPSDVLQGSVAPCPEGLCLERLGDLCLVALQEMFLSLMSLLVLVNAGHA